MRTLRSEVIGYFFVYTLLTYVVHTMEERTLLDAFRVVSLAKLDPQTLMPQSQAIEFVSKNQSAPNLILMILSQSFRLSDDNKNIFFVNL